jgi:uncharacterized OB-fold protein
MAELAKSPPEALFTLNVDAWTRPFWEAAARRVLVAPQCGACRRFRMPPTPFCPHCLTQALDWPTLSGEGIVYSYTIVSRAILPEMEAALPYVPALVELPDAGGVRLITNIVGVPVDAISIGAVARVVWGERSDGVVVPRFTLAARL